MVGFSGTDGEWLYELYEKDAENGKAMRRAVRTLFQMSSARRQLIYEVIAHDMKFAENTEVSFQFESILLEKEEQKLIEDFFVYFYDVVLCSAHFRLKGLADGHFERKEFAEKFFKGKNRRLMKVCPVCIQPVTNMQREGNVEHYFGKKWIPCLALHPYNLYITCPACNQIYKGAKKPLYRGEPEIRKIFLPYLDLVRDRTKMEFSHGLKTDQVKLSPADNSESYIDEKIEAFDGIFQLEERWSGLLETYYTSWKEECRELGISDIRDLESEMRRDLRKLEAGVRENPALYVQMKYQEWILNVGLKEFWKEIQEEKLEERRGKR